MEEAAEGTIVNSTARAKKPWITDATIQLIEKRSDLARQGQYADAEQVDKEIKKRARKDRRT
eukprot:5722389-Alexandrium_andersonii.AAC.1